VGVNHEKMEKISAYRDAADNNDIKSIDKDDDNITTFERKK
jgi:hypothetical protein